MANSKRESESSQVSKVIIIYKIFLGVIELILGVGIILFGHKIINLYTHYKDQELIEDPNDLIFKFSNAVVPYVFEHKLFVTCLLILLGLVKIVGGIGLLYKKHWGLDLLVGLIVFLLPFDIYDLIIAPTLIKFTFLLINILICLYLINFKPKQYFLRVWSSLAGLITRA